MWTAQQLRERYLAFFVHHGHAVIPSASLVPENDPSVLFTTAGMHPLVPYLVGAEHPAGTRLTSVQKCVRTGDIEEVGDGTHLTFFEMMGNWSLGDYGRSEAISWSWEFLTSVEWLGIDPSRIAVSVFAGDSDAPRDDASADQWRNLGVPDARIAFLDKSENWWPAGGGQPGPQGPDSEMFIWIGDGNAPREFDPADDHWVEVWNDVFMEFSRDEHGALGVLSRPAVDTGMGLERMLTVLLGKRSVYETDLFIPILAKIDELSSGSAIQSGNRLRWILADHLRAAVFIIGDPFGIAPSNIDQGYVARKLIRRAVRAGRSLGITSRDWASSIADVVIVNYENAYPELRENASRIRFELSEEQARFLETLERGERKFHALAARIGEGAVALEPDDAFLLYESYGLPLEVTEDLAREHEPPLSVDRSAFADALKKHQAQSRSGSGQRFVGGLADHSDQSVRYHTATHLLHQALRNVLGDHVSQRGSNITPQRMRFDFHHQEKVSSDDLERIERMVQSAIDQNLPVTYSVMGTEEARASGALGFFDDHYAKLGGDMKVYQVGGGTGDVFSREICGGPHVERTGMIGTFRIVKEKAVAQGVRRIRAEVIAPENVVFSIAQEKSLG
jgi:alanyl-tRNA synthetase